MSGKRVAIILVIGIICAVFFLRYRRAKTASPTYPNTSAHSDDRPQERCTADLARYVYHADRLRIVADCLSVRGRVMGMRAESDGDYHFRVAVAPEDLLRYPGIIGEGNIKRQRGNLVVEIICARQAIQRDAISVCETYRYSGEVPRIGDTIIARGPLVFDREHGWMEIHPAEVVVVH